MNIAFYTGVSGMIAFQKDMDTTAHNIANSKTAGYKAGRSSFSDLMYTEITNRKDVPDLQGHGVKNQAVDLILSQAGLNRTDQPLDFAIVGDGFFAVDRGGDEPEYTRNGAFSVSAEGRKGYLVTSDGGYVLDARGRRITLSQLEGSAGYDISEVANSLGIYTFPNAHGLARADGSSFTATATSGEAKALNRTTNAGGYDLISGALEFSSVELGDEMINMIEAQRAFQMNSKIVKTADEIEEMINNLR